MATATKSTRRTPSTTARTRQQATNNAEQEAEATARGLQADAGRVAGQVRIHAARLRETPATPLLFAVGAALTAARVIRSEAETLPGRVVGLPARVRDAVLVTSDNVSELLVDADARYADYAAAGRQFLVAVREQDSTREALTQARRALQGLDLDSAGQAVDAAREALDEAVTKAV